MQQKFHPLHGKQPCNKKDFLSVPTFYKNNNILSVACRWTVLSSQTLHTLHHTHYAHLQGYTIHFHMGVLFFATTQQIMKLKTLWRGLRNLG